MPQSPAVSGRILRSVLFLHAHGRGDRPDDVDPEATVAAERHRARDATVVGPPVHRLGRYAQDPGRLTGGEVRRIGRHGPHGGTSQPGVGTLAGNIDPLLTTGPMWPEGTAAM